ncbi:hypothetical protein GGX14DRAFT_418109 [Mycena pura]|uniref:Uncharacterized protein n=1 Tax=Mycena pura TaxID=153505 RepID=A0AAD7E3T8_9AGAR|nr:hypothetical protein GGX14DRAFT_418109 [Mycena pura]
MLRCCWRPLLQLGRHFAPRRRYSIQPQGLKSLAALHAFLAPANLASKEPITDSAKNIHKHYLAVKALPPRPKGHALNTYELNELLGLFASLSIPPPRPKCMYIHQFASRMRAAPFRTYWSLVLELAEEIRVRKHRKPRSGTHHYWVMRALLARMSAAPNENDRDHDDLASQVTTRYLRIRKTADPEVHIPYLRTMLSLRRGSHLAQIVQHLCKFLDLHANPDHRFAELVWEIVLGDQGDITAPIRARVLATLWTRLDSFRRPQSLRTPMPTRYVFDNISMRHIRLGVTIHQLCTALAMPIFPHFRIYLPTVVSTWAASEARATFGPQSPVASRWSSLVILALYAAPTAVSSRSIVEKSLAETEVDNAHIAWRTVFALAMLERTVQYGEAEPARTALRHLWRTWKNAELVVPLVVRCVVVGVFLRIAAKTRDGPLVDGCLRHCVAHSLWGTRPHETKADITQMTELLVDYVYAKLHIQGHRREDIWPEIFAALPPDSAAVQWRARVADALFRAFLSRDVETAQLLYGFCEREKIAISVNSVHALSLALARRYFPKEALRFLNDDRFSPNQVEELLDCIMCTLRRERHSFRDIPLAIVLSPAMKRLYLDTNRTPGARTKFSLRYALSVLADSNYAVEATALLRVLHERQPTFFSIHYFLRTMRLLVKHRRVAAVSLLNLVQSFPVLARQNFRRKFALRLARTGAHTLARYVYHFGGALNQRRSAREVLARAVRFRINLRDRAPPRRSAFKVASVIARWPKHVPTVRYGVALLARIGRIGAAKDAVENAQAAGLDTAAVTWLGNAVLNGALHRTKSKYARLVRHVLGNRNQLEQRVGFVQDRVTVNILVKVLLRWKTFMKAPRIRRLFDHLVRSGYPAPAQFRQRGGVPFGTETGSGTYALDTLRLSPFISFDRHVRPLYKMFIKALHLQGDLRGARTVIGILHSVEDGVMLQRHVRRRARLAGILRKKEKAGLAKGRSKSSS